MEHLHITIQEPGAPFPTATPPTVSGLWISSKKTRMLTAEEQWKIIQAEDERTGQGRRKKKTLIEQLEDMGGYGHDPDSEQAIRKDLERVDTRRPLQYSKDSISECEVSFGESSFWKSRKRSFHSWIFQASRQGSWIEEKDLPLIFRFALHRPIMDERSFRAILQEMDVQLEKPQEDVRHSRPHPIGRSKQLMRGVFVDQDRKTHVSGRLKHMLPTGGVEDMDKVREDATRMTQKEDEDMQQLRRRQLWTVYEHVQNGSVPLETATWHYRDAFNIQELSDENLAISLQQFGIPTDHIPTHERNARQSSVHSPFSSDMETFRDEIRSTAVPDAKERTIIKELVNFVGLYRSGTFQEREVILMIQQILEGLELEANIISDILNDLDKDEEMAALVIWEDACESDSTSVHCPLLMSSSSSSSSSDEETEASHEEHDNPLRAVLVPHVKEGEDRDAAAVSIVDGNKFTHKLTTGNADNRDDLEKNESEPETSEAMSSDQPRTSRPSISPGECPTSSHADKAERRVQSPGTPRPKHASLPPATGECSSQVDVEFDYEEPRDRATIGLRRPSSPDESVASQADVESDGITSHGRPNIGRRRSSSPDNGMTTGIWGLLMPTKEAREHAYRLRLPQETIDEVRSISPRRTKRKRARLAKTVVTCPKSKRKASIAVHADNLPDSPLHGDHSDLFAREGEDQEAFVLSHFSPDAVRSEDMCLGCLCLPGGCVCESSAGSTSEPDCPKCLQETCTCGRLPQLGEAVQTAPLNGNPWVDPPKAELADRSRPGGGNQSVMLLAYLARVLDNDSVYALIKKLEQLSSADTAIAAAKTILGHIQQGVSDGEVLDTTGDNDREALRILQRVADPLQALTDHQLHRKATKDDTSTTSVGVCHAEVGEGPDLESSLLNSTPGRDRVSAPPSNPVASTPEFLGTQSNVASGPVLQTISSPLADSVSPYLPTPTPERRVLRLKVNSGIENAVQLSRFQSGKFPDSSAAGDPSGAEDNSGSPAGGESPTAGSHTSRAKILPDSPARSPPSSTADCGEQVSDLPSDAEGDADHDIIGVPLTRRPNSKSWATGNCEVGRRPSATPRLRANELSKTMNATVQSCLQNSGFDSLPLWPAQPRLPEKAGIAWMGMTPKEALEHAKEEAFSQRKALTFYLEERRAARNRIKKENESANATRYDYSFFQSPNGPSGSSSTAVIPALNKIFDKYRGTPGFSLLLLS